jgi:hypothetical protein
MRGSGRPDRKKNVGTKNAAKSWSDSSRLFFTLRILCCGCLSRTTFLRSCLIFLSRINDISDEQGFGPWNLHTAWKTVDAILDSCCPFHFGPFQLQPEGPKWRPIVHFRSRPKKIGAQPGLRAPADAPVPRPDSPAELAPDDATRRSTSPLTPSPATGTTAVRRHPRRPPFDARPSR